MVALAPYCGIRTLRYGNTHLQLGVSERECGARGGLEAEGGCVVTGQHAPYVGWTDEGEGHEEFRQTNGTEQDLGCCSQRPLALARPGISERPHVGGSHHWCGTLPLCSRAGADALLSGCRSLAPIADLGNLRTYIILVRSPSTAPQPQRPTSRPLFGRARTISRARCSDSPRGRRQRVSYPRT